MIPFPFLERFRLKRQDLRSEGRAGSWPKMVIISLTGEIPISTFGGSKARGDPGAATGIYQLAEATLQLQNRANENQVPDAAIAMTQCLGGSGATASTHILRRAN